LTGADEATGAGCTATDTACGLSKEGVTTISCAGDAGNSDLAILFWAISEPWIKACGRPVATTGVFSNTAGFSAADMRVVTVSPDWGDRLLTFKDEAVSAI